MLLFLFAQIRIIPENGSRIVYRSKIWTQEKIIAEKAAAPLAAPCPPSCGSASGCIWIVVNTTPLSNVRLKFFTSRLFSSESGICSARTSMISSLPDSSSLPVAIEITFVPPTRIISCFHGVKKAHKNNSKTLNLSPRSSPSSFLLLLSKFWNIKLPWNARGTFIVL